MNRWKPKNMELYTLRRRGLIVTKPLIVLHEGSYVALCDRNQPYCSPFGLARIAGAAAMGLNIRAGRPLTIHQEQVAALAREKQWVHQGDPTPRPSHYQKPRFASFDEAITRDAQGNVKWPSAPSNAVNWGRCYWTGPSIDEMIKAGNLPKPTLWQRMRHFFKG